MNKETLRDVCYMVHLLTPGVRHTKEQLQNLYADTVKTHDYSYSVFKEDGTGEFRITDQRTPEITKYVFGSNSILLIHDFVNRIGVEHFLKSATDIISNAIKQLRIPIFVEQRYIIRCHANPLNLDDSRKFLFNRVCSLEDNNLNSFGRPAHGIGLRFFFPPTQEKSYEFDIKMESLLQDTKCLYLECLGRFFQPLQKENLDAIRTNMLITKDFIYSNMSDFLSQFNKKE